MHANTHTEPRDTTADGPGQPLEAPGPQLAVRYIGRDSDVRDALTRFDFVVTEWIAIGSSALNGSATAGLSICERTCDAVVIDGQQDDYQPLQLLKAVKAEGADLPVIFVVSPDGNQIAMAGLDLGADDVIAKTAVFERRLGAALRRVHGRIVTARQQDDRKARERRLRRFVDEAPDDLSVVAADGEFLAMNAAAARIYADGSRAEHGGIDIFALVATGAPAVTTADGEPALEGPSSATDLTLPVTQDASRAELLAAATRDHQQLMDEKRTLESELAEARRCLQAAEATLLEERSSAATERMAWAKCRRGFENDGARLLMLEEKAARETREIEAHLTQERSRWDSDRQQWESERAQWEQQKAAWSAEQVRWTDERAQWEETRSRHLQERVRWEHEREEAMNAARTQVPTRRIGAPSREGLEAVGALATAVAPDLERLLVGLKELSGLQGVAEAEPSRDPWALAEPAITQAAVLARQLAIFSRRQAGTRPAIDLQASVRGAGPLLSRLAGPQVGLTLRCGTDPITVAATTDDLEQLVTSLVVFGRDILPIGGSLSLEVQPASVEAGSQAATAGPVLSLSASGYGMQRPADTSVMTQLAERCGGELRVSGDAGRRVQLDVIFSTPTPGTPTVSAWRGMACA